MEKTETDELYFDYLQ